MKKTPAYHSSVTYPIETTQPSSKEFEFLAAGFSGHRQARRKHVYLDALSLSLSHAHCRLRHSVPIAMEMWLDLRAGRRDTETERAVHLRLEGVLATLSLKLMLSFVPAVLLNLDRHMPS